MQSGDQLFIDRLSPKVQSAESKTLDLLIAYSKNVEEALTEP